MDKNMHEQQPLDQLSPYDARIVPGSDIHLPTDALVRAEYYTRPAHTLEEAAASFEQFGAVMLAPEMTVMLDGQERTVAEVANEAREHVLSVLTELWGSSHRDEIIRKKNYDAYNHTGRDMRTVAFDNVLTYFPGVNKLQEQLLPVVREVNGDRNTEVSVDPDEGTVINLQMFDPNGPLDSKQEHGAHTDRVDTTAIICLENSGPQGNLIFIEGYTTACVARGLDPHQDFNANISQILADDPQELLFRVHRMEPGVLVLLHTDQDVHYITPKTLADVQQGEHETSIGDMRLGRGIINMAFETEYCRKIDMVAHEIEDRYDLHAIKSHAEFFARLDDAIKAEADGLDAETARLIRAAIIARLSAEDLYT
jgi:hypothetical protein